MQKRYIIEFEEKAKELVKQMTLEEKVSQMLNQSKGIERLKIKNYNWWNESLHGVARAGVATVFPQAIGLAATFNKDLMHSIGKCISTEGRAKFNLYQSQNDYGLYKGLTFWAPNINIFRDPRWGRGHETFGEDCHLTAEMAISYIKGIQGNHPKYLKAAACVKHFVAHSGPEGTRHGFNSKISKKDFYETYFPAFYRCITEAKVEGVMGAYNSVNDEICCASKKLIRELLRDKCKFDGYYVSDCGAIYDILTAFRARENLAEAAAMAVEAGCDLNCGGAYVALCEAVRMGVLEEKYIDECVVHLLKTKFKLGLIDGDNCPYNKIGYELNDCEAHHKLSLQAAEQSIVLLKNNGVLPLDKKTVKSIAIIGPNADDRDVLKANYNGTPSKTYTILEGVRQVADKFIKVRYAEGCHLLKNNSQGEYGDRLAEAEFIAKNSDVAIVCVGLSPLIEGEQGDAYNSDIGGDKPNLKLPGIQEELIKRICAVNKNTIVVNVSGSAVDLRIAEELASGVIQCFYPGMLGGLALANVVFGSTNPSGKLPVTFYNSTEDLPDFEDYSMKGRTYKYFDKPVLYKFGYGLSYSKFEISNVALSKKEIAQNQEVDVSLTISNNSDIDGYDTIQIYIASNNIEGQPIYQLRKFKKVFVHQNSSKNLKLKLRASDFLIVDDEGMVSLRDGDYKIYVGDSQPVDREDYLKVSIKGEK